MLVFFVQVSSSQGSSSTSQEQPPCWMSSDLCFVMAPSGGAMVKRKLDRGEPENIEATAVKLVTLIKELNRDDVVVEFFLYLLEVRPPFAVVCVVVSFHSQRM